jgi:hypothetical protein
MKPFLSEDRIGGYVDARSRGGDADFPRQLRVFLRLLRTMMIAVFQDDPGRRLAVQDRMW